MEYITDLPTIKRLSKSLYDEDWDFRNYLLTLDFKKLDTMVQYLYIKVSSKIDCRKCQNCCKELSPQFNDLDIERFAKGLKMTPRTFIKKYLKKDEDDPELFLVFLRPCPFLGKDGCAYYGLRPDECRNFPHLEQENFLSRSMSIISDQKVCPISFNVYQRLKLKLWKKSFKSVLDTSSKEED
jgi:Fe-S-cluster containining protein